MPRDEPTWVPFRYREFYDVPRILVTEHRGKTFILDCPFDEERDDYPPAYAVYRVHGPAQEWIERTSWIGLTEGHSPVGSIPVGAVHFDPTRRRFLDSTVLDPYL